MSAAPHVLLTNDDGIAAAGLAALRSALVGAGCAVTVMAPEGNRSATSHAITCRSGIRLWELPADDGALVYACSGTPVDCVRIGLLANIGPAPDIVVAGINHGINLGDDVYYSATVGAALEAVLVGCPAIAFSQQGEDGGVPFINVAEHRFELAPYAAAVVRWAARGAAPPRVALNVNLPCRLAHDRPAHARLGRRLPRGGIPVEAEEDGSLVVHPWGTRGRPQISFEDAPGSDYRTLLDGKVTVTPIAADAARPAGADSDDWLAPLLALSVHDAVASPAASRDPAAERSA
jgi:5'-nucleotidase